MSQPESLGSIVKELVDRMGWKQRIDRERIVEEWAMLAGPQINTVTESVWLKDRTLYVKITSSTWRQQLHLQRGQWRERLNENLGEEVVDEILFR